MRLRFVPASVFLLLVLFVVPVWGWSEFDWGGAWHTRTRNFWRGDYGDDEGWSSWEYGGNVSDFAGYNARVNFTDFDAKRKVWWEMREEKRFNIKWNFSDGSTSLTVLIQFVNAKESWGFFNDYWVLCAVSTNQSYFSPYWWFPYGIDMSRDDFLLFPSYVEVFVYKNGSRVVVHVVNERVDTEKPVCLWSESFEVGVGWFSNVTIEKKLQHGGHGFFKGGMSDTVYTGSYSPDVPDTEDIVYWSIWDVIDDLKGVLTKPLPSWMREWLAQFGGWFDAVLGIVNMLWGWFVAFMPLLPLVVLFWGVDAVGSSIHSGSVRPLGYFAMTIVNTLRGALSTLVEIGHTIYDFIHFW